MRLCPATKTPLKMENMFRRISLLTYLVSCLWMGTAHGQPAEQRVSIVSITPSVNTGQDYSAWLSDDLSKLVPDYWQPTNFQYIDIMLGLERPTTITRLRLYDNQGSFVDKPATLYALRGTQRTQLSVFTGELYQQWVDIVVSPGITADALVIRKYCNNLPQKIQVFGTTSGATTPTSPPPAVPTPAVITFGTLATKTVGDAPFALAATSTNLGTPIAFASSNPNVVSVSNAGGQWQATAVGAGSATITASQVAGGAYAAAASVAQPLTVQAAPGAPAPPVTPPTATGPRPLRLRQQFGVNAFEWDLEDPNRPGEVDESRLAAVKNFTGIRHYLDWEKLESSPEAYTYNPTHSGGWNYDAMYQRLKAEGIEVLVCIKTLPNWLLETWPAAERDYENVPVRYGSDFSSPNSYREQARLAFQFAARYGSNAGVNPGLLSVNSTPRWPGDGVNQVKIGLNLIQYMECDNERDKWWKGAKAYQSPAQYAANLSAFYDGHKNTMGPGVGVKNADPNMQVVMAGLAAPDPNYVRGMIEWCRQNRGYRADGSVNLCWDIINYHLYSNDAKTSQGGNSTRGSAPEVSEAGQVARDFVQMAREQAGGMPVWITETGYDVNQGSPLKAVAIGNRSIAETQADWILRTALLYARLSVERVFFYQLYDDNPGSTTQFASMGLLNADKSPRLAAQYLSQTNRLLGDYVFQQTLSHDPVVDRYELNGNSAYALVVPDERGRTAQYTLNLGSATYADVYRPTSGSQTMAAQRVNLQNGQLTLQVTETPVFVLASGSGATSTPPPSTASCSSTGTILREEWSNAPGILVSSIPVSSSPTSTSQLTQLETSRNTGDNYGTRIRGYLCAPQTGNYIFRIAGDDFCELWLSSDDTPSNKVRIAQVPGYTAWREWNKYSAQQSAAIPLTAGRRYYVEVLHKEQGGDDHVSVAWQLPDGTVEGPIPGRSLAPYGASAARSTLSASATAYSVAAGATQNGLASGRTKLIAFPAPITEAGTIEFTLATAGHATLELYDMQGRRLRQVFSGPVAAGAAQRVPLKASGLPTGTYLLRLTTDKEVLNQRIVVAK